MDKKKPFLNTRRLKFPQNDRTENHFISQRKINLQNFQKHLLSR